MANIITWPTVIDLGGTIYYTFEFSNQNLPLSILTNNYLKVVMDTEGVKEPAYVLVAPGSPEIVERVDEYTGQTINAEEKMEYPTPGQYARYYSPRAWNYGVTPEVKVFEIVWPSSYEYKGEVYYALKFTNQMDSTSRYIQRRGWTDSTYYESLEVTGPSDEARPVDEYAGQVVPDFDIQACEVETTDVRYYTNKKFDNKGEAPPPAPVPVTVNSALAIPESYLKFTRNYKEDIYAQMRNNMSDSALFLEHSLLGHRWFRDEMYVLQGGYRRATQWYDTVGKIKTYRTGDYNIDAIGVYATAICLTGLAQYCINKHWSLKLLTHLCLAMMSGRFEISELTSDTSAVEGTTYHRSETQSDAASPTRTAEDPEKDNYYVAMGSDEVLTQKIGTATALYYSLNKDSGICEKMVSLRQNLDPTYTEPGYQYYYIYDPDYEIASAATFSPSKQYFYRDSDGMYIGVPTRTVEMLNEAIAEYGTIYAPTGSGSFKSAAYPHYHSKPYDDSGKSFSLNGKDMYIREGSAASGYYYTKVGNAGRNMTVVLGYTRNNEYTEKKDCVVFRSAITGDSVAKLYVDKTNEYLEKIRMAINTYLLHYSRALQMLKRDQPAANAITPSMLYNIGDLVDRLNAIIMAINPYADPSAGQTTIKYIDVTEYGVRDLKLKSNEIVDFIRKDPKFITACQRVVDNDTVYEKFLPGDSLFIYNMIYDHVNEEGKWLDYNSMGFFYDPTLPYRDTLFKELDWTQVYTDSATDPQKGRIYTDGSCEGHHYTVYTGDSLVPLKNVIDLRRIAHAWHNCDYSGSMQIIDLMRRDLTVEDTNGVPWYTYLSQFDDGSVPRQALDKILSLLVYIDHLLEVGPIAANYVVDIYHQTVTFDPCRTFDKAMNTLS